MNTKDVIDALEAAFKPLWEDQNREINFLKGELWRTGERLTKLEEEVGRNLMALRTSPPETAPKRIHNHRPSRSSDRCDGCGLYGMFYVKVNECPAATS